MSKFLLILGPSGVGKSSIIQELCLLDDRFLYISPFTTRPLREGEVDKVHIGDGEMSAMDKEGAFLAVNQLYGTRYATPKAPVVEALRTGNFPILDWPVSQMETMEAAFPGKLYAVYILPPSAEVLADRLRRDGRDVTGDRLQKGIEELVAYENSDYEGLYEYCIVSEESNIMNVAKAIYDRYLRSFS